MESERNTWISQWIIDIASDVKQNNFQTLPYATQFV
jgi:hypothetical protein